MVKTSKNYTKSKIESGLASLIIVLLVGLASFSLVGGGVAIKNAGSLTNSNLADTKLSNLLNSYSNYLDENKIKGASFDGSAVGTVILPDGSFSAYRVVQGGVTSEGNKYQGTTKIEFLSNDFGVYDTDSDII